MKDVSIIESGKEFKFSGTNRLKTELQDEGSCYWVPKDERETGQIFASENREYTPEEINMYGIDQANVNVIFTGIDPEGNPWSVTIDPDTDLPVIEYPDSDIDMTIDPETGDVIIEPIDGIDPIAEIDGELLGDMDIDPMSDIDIVFDPPGDLAIIGDIDGIDTSIDLDLDSMEWESEECPTSIKIMHVPNKTSYKEGEIIDTDGLLIQAFKSDGTVWSSPKYPDGYIPAHELMLSQKSAIYSGTSMVYAPEYEEVPFNEFMSEGKNNGSLLADDVFNQIRKKDPNFTDEHGHHGKLDGAINDGLPLSGIMSYVTPVIGEVPFQTSKCIGYYTNFRMESNNIKADLYAIGGENFGKGIKLWNEEFHFVGSFYMNSVFKGRDEDGRTSIDGLKESGKINSIGASWVGPCLDTMGAEFDVSVSRAYTPGSHYSGKF